MEINGVAHIFITAGDFERSREFYSRLLPFLGLKEVADNVAAYYCVGGRTGFGINAMTGCFEFASLIVINDTDWWDEFGGAIQANWETEGMRRYSSLDYHQVAALLSDPAWSNEGLFAFCQAIRRLTQVGGDRVNLPTIELEP